MFIAVSLMLAFLNDRGKDQQSVRAWELIRSTNASVRGARNPSTGCEPGRPLIEVIFPMPKDRQLAANLLTSVIQRMLGDCRLAVRCTSLWPTAAVSLIGLCSVGCASSEETVRSTD